MNITDFTTEQRRAVMDLLVLGMYAEGNLTSAEGACVQRLLNSFQFPSDFERNKFSDAALTRTSRHTGSPDAIRAYMLELAKQFHKADMRQSVYDRSNELLTSDGRVTAEESQLLCAVKAAFQL